MALRILDFWSIFLRFIVGVYGKSFFLGLTISTLAY